MNHNPNAVTVTELVARVGGGLATSVVRVDMPKVRPLVAVAQLQESSPVPLSLVERQSRPPPSPRPSQANYRPMTKFSSSRPKL